MIDKDSLLNILTGGAEDDDVRVWFWDEIAYAWRAAQEEAVMAYEAWRESGDPGDYVVYRAAQDRADQAQDVLATRPQAA